MFLKTKKQKLLVVLFLIFVCFFLINQYWPEKEKIKTTSAPLAKESISSEKVFLEIENIKYEILLTGEISIYDLMDLAKRKEFFTFTEKNYVGMGKFIESINGIKNSGDRNWIYYINGEKANIGVSNYKIKSGDVVSWKYESQY